MVKTMEMAGGGMIRQWEDGGRVCFRCEAPLRRDGLYKVWLKGEGEEFLLGTLTPEGGSMLLCRAVGREELRRCGCWPVCAARCAMAYPFRQQQIQQHRDGWYWEEAPARLVDDETAKLGRWSRMLCRKTQDHLELACPIKKEEPLPLVHLFCLARTKRIRGELCLVWRFDGEGRPVFPPITSQS